MSAVYHIFARMLPWLLGAAILPLICVAYVQEATRDARYEALDAVPQQRVAVVFGAGVRPDGLPSPMLADRVEAAVALYQQGRVQRLLMTGDNSSTHYDEVSVMKQYAVAHGVPAADITLDYAGFSTYESCYRARAIFGVQQAVLVTQRYHLARAVYTCRALGVDAVGFGTPDWGVYGKPLLIQYGAREALATANALWQIHVTRPLPTFLGPFEGIQ